MSREREGGDDAVLGEGEVQCKKGLEHSPAHNFQQVHPQENGYVNCGVLTAWNTRQQRR